MKIPHAVKYFLLLLFISGVLYSQDTNPLFEIEKKFCKTLTEEGLSKAFSQFIAEEGIMLVPLPANGKEYYQKHPNDFKGLNWEADFAEISSGNDFGYTTGPWVNTKTDSKGKTVITYGHFITVWEKINGEWHFLIDCGVIYDKKLINKESTNSTNLKPVPAAEKKFNRFVFEDLIKIDNDFAGIAYENNLAAAYEKYASENIRVYRDKKYPCLGINEAKAFFTKRKLNYSHMGGKATQAGDFAFTYGVTYTKDDKPEFNSVKVWKKEGKDWKIVLDVLTGVN